MESMNGRASEDSRLPEQTIHVPPPLDLCAAQVESDIAELKSILCRHKVGDVDKIDRCSHEIDRVDKQQRDVRHMLLGERREMINEILKLRLEIIHGQTNQRRDHHKATLTDSAIAIAQDTPSDWKPVALRSFPALSLDVPPLANLETFSWEFIISTFGGQHWSPGFYWIPPEQPCLLQNRSYYVLDTDYDPYLPSIPGTHGAKLTAMFNDCGTDKFGNSPQDNAYEHTPLFISLPSDQTSDKRYYYFGDYTQTRYSDRLDHDTQSTRVSGALKSYWADQLSSSDRPAWVTEKLRLHFWPKPTYTGPLAKELMSPSSRISQHRALAKHLADLVEWDKESSCEVSKLSAEDIMAAFTASDAGAGKGLRLWWEYLCCTGWNREFYDMLVRTKAQVSRGNTQIHADSSRLAHGVDNNRVSFEALKSKNPDLAKTNGYTVSNSTRFDSKTTAGATSQADLQAKATCVAQNAGLDWTNGGRFGYGEREKGDVVW